MRVQVRVRKKYFFEFEFGKMIEFFRVHVRVRSPDWLRIASMGAHREGRVPRAGERGAGGTVNRGPSCFERPVEGPRSYKIFL